MISAAQNTTRIISTLSFLTRLPENIAIYKALRFWSNFVGPIEENRRRSSSYVEDLTTEEREKAA